jgi:cyclic pyranopterin phosphate synthase
MGISHINKDGNAVMIDVSNKSITLRTAVAKTTIKMKSDTLSRIYSFDIKKGDVLGVAQVAGIMGAKKTSDIIPMCHPLLLTGIDIKFDKSDELSELYITATVKVTGQTGVEMEALTAVTVAALTVYDMCKSIDKNMEICNTILLEKTGGKSGTFRKL